MAEGCGLLERGNFGVVAEVIEVCAFAEGLVAAREDAADGGIGTGEGGGVLREDQGAGEVMLVLWG